jgi:RNA methyltransferase, TrmH family
VLSKAKQKLLQRLVRDKKFRNAEGLFVAEGERAVSELCAAAPESLDFIALSETSRFKSRFSDKTFLLSEADFSELADTETAQGVAAVFHAPDTSEKNFLSRLGSFITILALDGIQDPGNLGTMIRTAAWFNADAVLASDSSADFFSPKVVRATAGSLFALTLCRTKNFSALLRDLKPTFTLYGATLGGKSLSEISFAAPRVLVIGNEGNGISERVLPLLDTRLTISGNASRVESLNAAVSAGIILNAMMGC